ncbi:MAG: hypothetical protein HYY16_00305 [Planctomycetes bacterium]|nr:hypothetical protein [Planctomycetota bacterium]
MRKQRNVAFDEIVCTSCGETLNMIEKGSRIPVKTDWCPACNAEVPLKVRAALSSRGSKVFANFMSKVRQNLERDPRETPKQPKASQALVACGSCGGALGRIQRGRALPMKTGWCPTCAANVSVKVTEGSAKPPIKTCARCRMRFAGPYWPCPGCGATWRDDDRRLEHKQQVRAGAPAFLLLVLDGLSPDRRKHILAAAGQKVPPGFPTRGLWLLRRRADREATRFLRGLLRDHPEPKMPPSQLRFVGPLAEAIALDAQEHRPKEWTFIGGDVDPVVSWLHPTLAAETAEKWLRQRGARVLRAGPTDISYFRLVRAQGRTGHSLYGRPEAGDPICPVCTSPYSRIATISLADPALAHLGLKAMGTVPILACLAGGYNTGERYFGLHPSIRVVEDRDDHFEPADRRSVKSIPRETMKLQKLRASVVFETDPDDLAVIGEDLHWVQNPLEATCPRCGAGMKPFAQIPGRRLGPDCVFYATACVRCHIVGVHPQTT